MFSLQSIELSVERKKVPIRILELEWKRAEKRSSSALPFSRWKLMKADYSLPHFFFSSSSSSCFLIMFVYRSFAAIEMNKQPISHKLFAKRQWYEMRWDGVKSSSNCLTFAPDVWFILIFSHIYLYTVTDLGSRNPPTNQHTDSCLFHSLFYSWANIENSTDIILCSIQRPKTFHRYVFLLIERERNR